MTPDSSPYPSLSPSPEKTSIESSSAPAERTPRTADTPGSATSPDPLAFASATDGLADRLFHPKSKGPVAAIFIHAGAGFHSTVNEHMHLEACRDAARIAMKFLKAGGTAVDAVEAAIKSLEDTEITNAGFGSNLTIDGVVEGDATIVDHLGRSGACGAAPMVKNPISLARLIYDRSNIPLTLRRIPPNVLVGNGATRFAQEHGMRLVPHQHLISKGAHDRFMRWSQDLVNAENAVRGHRQGFLSVAGTTASAARPSAAPQGVSANTASSHSTEQLPMLLRSEAGRATTTSMAASSGQPGEGPDSSANQAASLAAVAGRSVGVVTVANAHAQAVIRAATSSTGSASLPAASSWPPRKDAPQRKRPRLGNSPPPSHSESLSRRSKGGSSGDGSHEDISLNAFQFPAISETIAESLDRYPDNSEPSQIATGNVFTDVGLNDNDTDIITDTIGAIAIDLRGNIAAGSSSGGIGMKHSGRIGPAALVGIGTAVVPANPKDSSGTCVAAVTSGTGEHMATTMASHTCAERLYHNQRRAEVGSFESEYDDDAIMKSFIMDDFMNHPGVKNQISSGAIGVMAAKKTNKSIYFYFAHNTDSFALASMASNEQDASVVISRLGPKESVARGGRKIKP